MRLVLAVPPSLLSTWVVESDCRIAMRVDPAVSIIASGLLPLPDDVPRWVNDVQQADRRDGSSIVAAALVERETLTGWRFRIATARIVVEGAPSATRLGAFYRFLEHVAWAQVTFPFANPDRQRVEEAIEIFATARPEFSSQIAAVQELWR
jgi:hypothetical protein